MKRQFTRLIFFSDKECLREIASHEVNFALYHQMVGQNDEEHFRQIPAEYFDLIIVDECHRGSAKEDSNWRKVLEYFSSATQIGMTATPKESEQDRLFWRAGLYLQLKTGH